MSDRDSVILVHGAIRRPSTMKWMRQLRAHLAQRGITAALFGWSGIPTQMAVRWAAKRLAARINSGAQGPPVVWAKSTGADIAYQASLRSAVSTIVRVAPAYVVTQQLEPSPRGITVELASDSFLGQWARFGIVRRLPPPALEPVYLINGAPGLNHHALNLNQSVTIGDGRSIRLYDLYAELIGAALGNNEGRP